MRNSTWCMQNSQKCKNNEHNFQTSEKISHFLYRFAVECECARFFIIYYCIAHRFFFLCALLLTAQERFAGYGVGDVEKRSSCCWTLFRCSLDWMLFLLELFAFFRSCLQKLSSMLVERVWLSPWWRWQHTFQLLFTTSCEQNEKKTLENQRLTS